MLNGEMREIDECDMEEFGTQQQIAPKKRELSWERDRDITWHRK